MVWERLGKCLRTVRERLGNGMRKVFELYRTVWELFGNSLGMVCERFGKGLGTVLE